MLEKDQTESLILPPPRPPAPSPLKIFSILLILQLIKV